MPVVDRRASIRFLETAYRPTDWVAVLLKSSRTSRATQRVTTVARITTVTFQRWLRAENGAGFNVFISLNALVPDQRSRRREVVQTVRHVFLDADHNASALLRAIGERRDLPPPSCVLHSSPHRLHVLWRVEGFTTDRCEALQKSLARDLGADMAATSCSQMTRLPSFVNHKYATLPVVTIEYRDPERVYRPTDFPPVVASPAPAPAAACISAADRDRVARARQYVEALPPAIAGQRGDLHTFRVCCRLTRGFALSDRQALAILRDWNAHCQPPWSDRELVDKVKHARRYGREPIGALLEVPP